jgi:hypothetical protein
MRGKFRHRGRLGRGRDDIRGSLRNPQGHGVPVSDKEIAHAVGAWAGREQRKAAPEERMGGIGDLNFRRVVYQWVVDRGIKMFDRSMKSTMAGCSRFCNTASETHGSSD